MAGRAIVDLGERMKIETSGQLFILILMAVAMGLTLYLALSMPLRGVGCVIRDDKSALQHIYDAFSLPLEHK